MPTIKREADSLSFETDDKVSKPEIGQKGILSPSSDKSLNPNLKIKAVNKTGGRGLTPVEATFYLHFPISKTKVNYIP